MATALLGLGSNLGNREETLRAALVEIDALPDVRVRKASEFYSTRPVGGPPGQGEFLNAAVAIETKTPPLQLLDEVQDIESRHGRDKSERWAARPLDIDLLLYADEVMETPMLTLPHPRMTFRRFVLQPATEVAARMLHPVIGWPVERFLLHLNSAGDQVAIVSPSENFRRHFAEFLAKRFGARSIDRPSFAVAEQLWPSQLSAFVQIPSSPAAKLPASGEPSTLPYAAAAFPKLTILLDAEPSSPKVAKAQWSAVVRRPGRGPTLRLQETQAATFQSEIDAAIAAVWPDLGPANANRLE
jgi:2-amino-4-hydroxy-6-hydroxymethyldihydropteridine diphosphokinase